MTSAAVDLTGHLETRSTWMLSGRPLSGDKAIRRVVGVRDAGELAVVVVAVKKPQKITPWVDGAGVYSPCRSCARLCCRAGRPGGPLVKRARGENRWSCRHDG